MSLPLELAFVFGEVSNVFHRTRVVSREMVAESTLALVIERPENFTFTPGQNVMVSIPGAHAEHLKEFTIASAPYEPHIMLAMRVRNSEFKHACYALKPGDAIMVRDPAGVLWDATSTSQVWLSGGIGITPFRGIMRELIHNRASLAVTHIHSDRTRTGVPFLQEFESFATAYKGYTFVSTMTREAGQSARRGRITADMIRACAPDYALSDFFVVGTDSFVASMREEIFALGVSPSPSRVRTERFDGYKMHDA